MTFVGAQSINTRAILGNENIYMHDFFFLGGAPGGAPIICGGGGTCPQVPPPVATPLCVSTIPNIVRREPEGRLRCSAGTMFSVENQKGAISVKKTKNYGDSALLGLVAWNYGNFTINGISAIYVNYHSNTAP